MEKGINESELVLFEQTFDGEQCGVVINRLTAEVRRLAAKVDELEVTVDDEEASGLDSQRLHQRLQASHDSLSRAYLAVNHELVAAQATIAAQFGLCKWGDNDPAWKVIGKPQAIEKLLSGENQEVLYEIANVKFTSGDLRSLLSKLFE